MKEPGGYWGRDYTAPVKYDVVQKDPLAMRHAERVYRSEQAFLDTVARVITLKETDSTIASHPTGGRAGVQPLRVPFKDPQFGMAILEIDVKGIGMTDSGCTLFQHDLRHPHRRGEIMIHEGRNEAFGPLSLEQAVADANNIRIARRAGILAPYPIAVLKLYEFSIDGTIVPVAEARRHYGLDKGDIGLLVRGYPFSSMRISDYVQSPDCDPPPLMVLDRENEVYINRAGTVLREVLNWRKIWQTHERPRMMSNNQEQFFRNQGKGNADTGYFQWYLSTQYHQIAAMIKSGISPSSGKESDNQRARHTHIQNGTTAGAEVEWVPITQIDRLAKQHRKDHIRELLENAHARVTICGAAVLSDFGNIPSFEEFVRHIRQGTSSPEIRELEKKTTKLTDAEIAAEERKGNSIVFVQSYGRMDGMIPLLKDNQQAILRGRITLPEEKRERMRILM